MNVFDEELSDDELAAFVFIRLSPRELEIARLIYQGKLTKQISVILGVSQRTVDFYRYQIHKKLSLRTLAEVVVLGWRIRRHLFDLKDIRSKELSKFN